MNWSLRIGRLFRIPVRVHWSMLFLLLFLSWGGGALGVLAGLVAIALVFASVVAHELAHALTARHYGIGTSEILLMPIGGVAKIEREPANGRQEVAIALAGPAMSLALAGASALLSVASAGIPVLHPIAATLASANLMLGLFNLLPAFPMDGGRVLRGALRERRGLLAATRFAAKLGRILAIPMAVAGIALGSFSLVLVAGFVWLAGRAEQRAVEARAFWQANPFLGVPLEEEASSERGPVADPFAAARAQRPSAGDSEWMPPRAAPGPVRATWSDSPEASAQRMVRPPVARPVAVQRGGRRFVVVVGPFGYVIREV